MFHRYRYSHWDGSQEALDLDADGVLEELSDDLIRDGNLWRALRRLFQRGVQDRQGQHRAGLRDLQEQLRAARQQELRRYDLDSVIKDVKEKLERVLATERAGIERRLENSRQRLQEGEVGEQDQTLHRTLEKMAAQKQKYLNDLPKDPAGQIKGLWDYDFMDPEARQQFQELMQMLQQQMLQQQFRGMQQGMQNLTPQDIRQMKEMLRDLNQMLRERAEGGRPDFPDFMRRHGQYFEPGLQNLDDLLDSLQRSMAQMQSLLDSMSPEMRGQLQDMLESLMRDEGLRDELAKLAANIEELRPSDDLRQAYPFSGDEPVTLTQALRLMKRLARMDDLEAQLERAEDAGNPDAVDAAELRDVLGDQAADALEQLKQLEQMLEDAGYVRRRGRRLELTPQATRKIGQKALRDIFDHLKREGPGKHETQRLGSGGDRAEDTKRYEFGDQFHLNIQRTLMNALEREGPGSPVAIKPEDFEVHRTEYLTQSATVVMIDMSRSMMLRGCFFAAKKVALALDSLIRWQFPRDSLYIIAFADRARQINPQDLPELQWNEHMCGTNLQHALQLARKLLAKHKGGNRQIIVVTDGEPTAHLEEGEVSFCYPPTQRTIEETLKEVVRCTRESIVINTFMLEQGEYLGAFVNHMTRLNRGRAFYATPQRLGDYIMVDYVASKHKRIA